MRTRPIPLGVHAMAEPLLALLLVLAPFLFGFSDVDSATAISILAGVALLVVGMSTNWRLSLFNLIPLPIHAMLDIGMGVFLIASPFLFGFSDEAAPTVFFVLFGLTEVLASLGTRWSHAEDVGLEERSGRQGRFTRQGTEAPPASREELRDRV
jgi:hypothetical protein